MRAVEGCRPAHMTASSIVVALADQIFYRFYVNQQHFRLRSFASLCLDGFILTNYSLVLGTKSTVTCWMGVYQSKALCCVLFVIVTVVERTHGQSQTNK